MQTILNAQAVPQRLCFSNLVSFAEPLKEAQAIESVVSHAPIEMPLIDFLRQCRRPLHYKTAVNKLRNHEALSLGGVRQSLGKQRFAYGQAYLKTLTKGQYTFVGLWAMDAAHQTNPTRLLDTRHLYVTQRRDAL